MHKNKYKFNKSVDYNFIKTQVFKTPDFFPISFWRLYLPLINVKKKNSNLIYAWHRLGGNVLIITWLRTLITHGI